MSSFPHEIRCYGELIVGNGALLNNVSTLGGGSDFGISDRVDGTCWVSKIFDIP